MGLKEALTKRKCEPCEGGVPPLDETGAKYLHAYVDPAWEVTENKLVRNFEFKNFRDAFGLATRIALLAEDEGHHPDMEISWGKLGVTLTTHAIKGLSDNDFIMAAKIDEMV